MTPDTMEENKTQENDGTIPASFSCKVIRDSEELPRSSRQWTRAQKCTLKLDHTQLSFCGKDISYDEIDEATIHVYQSALFFEYGVFTVNSNGTTDHFGIKYDNFWKGELPFAVERVNEETPFLLFRKSLIIVIIIYIFWELINK